MGGVLVGLDEIVGELAVLGDAGADARERLAIQRLDGGARLAGVGKPAGGFEFQRNGCGHFVPTRNLGPRGADKSVSFVFHAAISPWTQPPAPAPQHRGARAARSRPPRFHGRKKQGARRSIRRAPKRHKKARAA